MITRSTMAYTNHTLLPEALEKWPVAMFRRLLPRLLDIIYEINARFIAEISQRWPGDNDRIQRMSLIQEGSEPMIRMAYLAIVGSFSVNGVAELHSQLLREGLFRDFAELWPEQIQQQDQRRHPTPLARRLQSTALQPDQRDKIGDGWKTELDKLEESDKGFATIPVSKPGATSSWRTSNAWRTTSKRRPGSRSIPDMLFDVQVKRIHEYKRQLLNVLHAIHLYDRIRRGDGDGLVPRADHHRRQSGARLRDGKNRHQVHQQCRARHQLRSGDGRPTATDLLS